MGHPRSAGLEILDCFVVYEFECGLCPHDTVPRIVDGLEVVDDFLGSHRLVIELSRAAYGDTLGSRSRTSTQYLGRMFF